MDRKLIIVGLSHYLQCGCKPFTESDIAGILSFVRNLCRSEGVHFIAEEMSQSGLEEYSVESTIFWALKSESDLNVDVVNVDIERKLRTELSIGDELPLASRQPDELGPPNELEKLFDSHLTQTIRECSWLAHIICRKSWPALLICGANHVKSVESRATSLGMNAVVACTD